jgi:hypothetical protein
MELVDRYLHAVKPFLPRRDQDDILRELSEDIYSQIAEQEETLGRPLTSDELRGVIKRYGHPMLLASRFRPNPPLISGPLMPFYWQTLKISVGVALLVNVIISTILLATGRPPDQFIGGLAKFPLTAVTIFGWITLAFACLEAGALRQLIAGTWDPTSLTAAGPDRAHVSRVESFAGALFGTLFIGWLIALPRSPWFMLGPAYTFLQLAPIWQTVYVPIVVLAVISVVVHYVNFFKPYQAPTVAGLVVLIHVGTFVIMCVLLSAGPLVTVTGPMPPDKAEKLLRIAQIAFQLGLVGCAISSAIEAVKRGRRLYRGDYRKAEATGR